jgi:RNA polymerase sigma factor (sigma-70 family)
VADLRAAEPGIRSDAAKRIWERFAPRLCALARNRLNPGIRVRADEDDIVQSMFQSFFAVQEGGECPLKNREELWRFLVWMTVCKIANAARHHRRARRDVRREHANLSRDGDFDSLSRLREELQDFKALSPADIVISRLELARVLRRLRKDLRQVILWKLDGYSNAEIGRKIDRTERTVEIKMRLIRETLTHDLLAPDARASSAGNKRSLSS